MQVGTGGAAPPAAPNACVSHATEWPAGESCARRPCSHSTVLTPAPGSLLLPTGPLPYELVATEPHFPHPCIVGRAEEGRLVLRAHSKVKGQEGVAMAEAELFRAAFPATLGSGGGSAQAGAAVPAASGSSGSSQGSLPRVAVAGVLDSPRSPAAYSSTPATPRSPAAGGSAPTTPRSLRRASISSTGSTAAAAAMAAGPSPGTVWEVGCHLAVAPRAETPLVVALCTIYKAALDRRAVDAVREIKAAAAKAAAKAAKASQRAERAGSAAAGKAGAAGAPAGGTGGTTSGPPSPPSSRSGSVTARGGGSPPPSVGVPTPLRSPAARSPTLSSVGEIEEEPEEAPPMQQEQSLRQQYAVQPVAA